MDCRHEFSDSPSIPQAIINRAKHPAYGYFDPTDQYYGAIINWQRTRHGLELSKEAIGYENGVIGAATSALNSFAAPGDSILVHSPTYLGFTGMLNDNGYRIVHSSLKPDSQGIWRMDYADMRNKLRENNIHFAIFCSPHNPCGRVWEYEEIKEAVAIYQEAECIIISDEIWSDILLNGSRHIPTQAVGDYAQSHTVAIYAPSKTFNLAGLVGSYHVIYNKALRDRVNARGIKTHYNEMNVLSMHALIGAYSSEGAEWTDELCQVLSENINYAYDYINNHFKGVYAGKPQGTYMFFMNCKQWCNDHKKLSTMLSKRDGMLESHGRTAANSMTLGAFDSTLHFL